MAFTDDFAGTNGDEIGSRTGWTKLLGAYKCIVASNGFGGQSDSGSGVGVCTCTDQGDADNYVQLDLLSVASRITGACTRVVDKDNWWGFWARGTGSGGLRIVSCSAGTITTRASGQPVVATYKLEAVTNGTDTDLKLFEDSGSGFSSKLTATRPNTEVSGTETTQGIFNSGQSTGTSTAGYDNFEAGALGGGGGVLAIPIAAYHYNHPMRD